MSEPAFVARAAAVLCLGSGVGLSLLAFRLADHSDVAKPPTIDQVDDWDAENLAAEGLA